jgi:hypothetical protein
MGGLGNQMYQYALFLVLEKKYPNQLIMGDLSIFNNNKRHWDYYYGFGIKTVFNLEIPIATSKDINSILPKFPPLPFSPIKKLPFFELGYIIIKKLYLKFSKKYQERIKNIIFSWYSNYNGTIFLLDEKENYYLLGNWQNIKYIKNHEHIIKRLFYSRLTPAINNDDKLLLNKIECTQSICIHIRYFGYENEKASYSSDLCNIDYYRETIKVMERKLRERNIDSYNYFVFSPDIELSKKEFAFLNATFINHRESMVDMFLMSRCTHAIIGNSTFAFWAAYISDMTDDKIVICPQYYQRTKDVWYEFSVPDKWIKIDNTSYFGSK